MKLKISRLLLRIAQWLVGEVHEPEAVPAPLPRWFDFASDSTLSELMAGSAFPDALRAVAHEEMSRLTDYMRDKVRQEQYSEASRAEQAIAVWEQIEVVFRQYAGEFSAARREQTSSEVNR